MDGPHLAALRRHAQGFNGATAVRPWMDDKNRVYGMEMQLQWGHGREAMDGAAWYARYG